MTKDCDLLIRKSLKATLDTSFFYVNQPSNIGHGPICKAAFSRSLPGASIEQL